MNQLTDLRKNSAQNLFRSRSIEDRDREEQHWRKTNPRPPAEVLFRSYLAKENEPVEQTESHATDLDATACGEISKLHPDAALKIIEKNLHAALATTGHPSPQEAQKVNSPT